MLKKGKIYKNHGEEGNEEGIPFFQNGGRLCLIFFGLEKWRSYPWESQDI